MTDIHAANVRTPLLRDDGSTLDFLDASYAADITQSDGSHEVKVTHHLRGAPAVRHAITTGDAAYVTEIRNHYGFTSRTYAIDHPEQVVKLAPRDFTDARTYLYPGVVAVKQFDLPVSDLHPVWQRSVSDVVAIPAGALLAMATPERLMMTNSPIFSIQVDRDLPDGQMRVVDASSDEPRFDVFFATDIYPHAKAKDPFGRALRVMAWSHVMALLPRTDMAKGGAHEHSLAAQRLRAVLRKNGVSNWDANDFDASRAATIVAPLAAPLTDEE